MRDREGRRGGFSRWGAQRCPLAGFLVVAVAACGPQTLSKAEFITRGDRLCRRFEERSRVLQLTTDPFQPGAAAADLQAAPRFLAFFAANLPKLAGDLRGLSPPPEDNRSALDRMLRILDESGRQFDAARRAFDTGDFPSAKAMVDRAFGRLEQAAASAQDYGFKDCGSPAAQSTTRAAPAPPGPEIAVTATEYAFQMPPEVTPGLHTFVIRNDGKERHFLVLRKLKPGIGFQRLIDSQRVGESIAGHIEQSLGQSDIALPATTVRFNADLSPGNYAYACFIAAPDGELHALKGMAGQLTVRQP